MKNDAINMWMEIKLKPPRYLSPPIGENFRKIASQLRNILYTEEKKIGELPSRRKILIENNGLFSNFPECLATDWFIHKDQFSNVKLRAKLLYPNGANFKRLIKELKIRNYTPLDGDKYSKNEYFLYKPNDSSQHLALSLVNRNEEFYKRFLIKRLAEFITRKPKRLNIARDKDLISITDDVTNQDMVEVFGKRFKGVSIDFLEHEYEHSIKIPSVLIKINYTLDHGILEVGFDLTRAYTDSTNILWLLSDTSTQPDKKTILMLTSNTLERLRKFSRESWKYSYIRNFRERISSIHIKHVHGDKIICESILYDAERICNMIKDLKKDVALINHEIISLTKETWPFFEVHVMLTRTLEKKIHTKIVRDLMNWKGETCSQLRRFEKDIFVIYKRYKDRSYGRNILYSIAFLWRSGEDILMIIGKSIPALIKMISREISNPSCYEALEIKDTSEIDKLIESFLKKPCTYRFTGTMYDAMKIRITKNLKHYLLYKLVNDLHVVNHDLISIFKPIPRIKELSLLYYFSH